MIEGSGAVAGSAPLTNDLDPDPDPGGPKTYGTDPQHFKSFLSYVP